MISCTRGYRRSHAAQVTHMLQKGLCGLLCRLTDEIDVYYQLLLPVIIVLN